jgi:hypothetical protein
MTDETHVEKTQVKGKAIASIPKFVQKTFGKEGYQQWLDAISAEAHNIFIMPINMNDWFPLKETVIQPLANIAQLFFQWDIKKASWESGRFSADFGLGGIYKIFVKMGSATFFINKFNEYLVSYYQNAKCETSIITESHARILLTHFPDIENSVEFRIAGWIERFLEINGCKNVKIEIPKALSNRKPYTEYLVSWE